MKTSILKSALVASLFRFAHAQDGSSSNGCAQENGNWYCQQTNAVTYSTFGQTGSFNKVTSMDPNSGTCTSQRQNYAGGLAPLDEVSWHFRGPFRLKQFAFYTLGQSGPVRGKSKRDAGGSFGRSLRRRHSHHQRLHLDVAEQGDSDDQEQGTIGAEEERVDHVLDDRGLGDWVTVTMNGKVVSWQNQWSGAGSPATARPASPSRPPSSNGGNSGNTGGAGSNNRVPSQGQNNNNGNNRPQTNMNQNGKPNQAQNSNAGRPAAASATAQAQPANSNIANPPPAAPSGQSNPPPQNHPPPQQQNPGTTTISLVSPSTPASPSSSSPPSTNTNPPPSGGNTWTRQSYYTSSAPGSTQNLAFLGHHGSQSCSGTFDYAFGLSLSYLTPDGQNCSPAPQPLSDTLLPDNTEISLFTGSPCTASNPCPYSRPGGVAHHGFSGASKLFLIEFSMPLSGQRGWNKDMPAAWLLNAMIPRTLQYGKAECSCWQTGCGEFDVMEVLDSGNQKMKSTWHGQGGMGDSHWFQRPTGGSRKAAVVMDGARGSVSVLWLDQSVDFGSAKAASDVQGWIDRAGGVQAKLGVA